MPKEAITAVLFDTETTGLWNFKAKPSDPQQPNLVQLAFRLVNLTERKVLQSYAAIVRPDMYDNIHPKAVEVHGISMEIAARYGRPHVEVVDAFLNAVDKADMYICHNTDFDTRIMSRASMQAHKYFEYKMAYLCTMKHPKVLAKYGPKWPKLVELHKALFGKEFEGAHDALEDILATERCLYELLDQNVIQLKGVNA